MQVMQKVGKVENRFKENQDVVTYGTQFEKYEYKRQQIIDQIEKLNASKPSQYAKNIQG